MRTIVSKFGGSSTAGARQFHQILALVRASPGRRCVVLSAPGVDGAHAEKVTSLLERCWLERANTRALEAAVDRVAARFSELSVELGLPEAGEAARREILGAVAVSRACALSRGEYLCARLFSEWSGIPMHDATELVCFDARGELDLEKTLRRMAALRDGGTAVVVPGFYGADPNGRVRVFERNGSDISGALAAAGMEADLYENWTDVPGLMTADPAVVPDARLIRQVSYRQMRALARAGARVLHPACLDPVAMAGIPTRLRCTWNPDCFGTLIDDACSETAPCVTGCRDVPLPGVSGARCACVSVFGAPASRVRSWTAGLHPLFLEDGVDAVKVFVRADAFEEGIRMLHDKLTGGTGGSG